MAYFFMWKQPDLPYNQHDRADFSPGLLVFLILAQFRNKMTQSLLLTLQNDWNDNGKASVLKFSSCFRIKDGGVVSMVGDISNALRRDQGWDAPSYSSVGITSKLF